MTWRIVASSCTVASLRRTSSRCCTVAALTSAQVQSPRQPARKRAYLVERHPSSRPPAEGEPEIREALAGDLRGDGVDARTGFAYRRIRSAGSVIYFALVRPATMNAIKAKLPTVRSIGEIQTGPDQ